MAIVHGLRHGYPVNNYVKNKKQSVPAITDMPYRQGAS
jgi:hypothetical protein